MPVFVILTKNKDKVYEQVEYLIMSVGISYEPLALNICLVRRKTDTGYEWLVEI